MTGELIQIMPADGWYAKFYNLKDGKLPKKNDSYRDHVVKGNVESYYYEKILALGLMKDEEYTYVAGIENAFEEFCDEITQTNFVKLVYLPECKKDSFTEDVN